MVTRTLDLYAAMGGKATVEVCDACGEPVPVGAWPFCASDANPAGHSKGTYRWKTKFTMKTSGWTRRER
jgi:hypothetical protein